MGINEGIPQGLYFFKKKRKMALKIAVHPYMTKNGLLLPGFFLVSTSVDTGSEGS